MNNKRRRPWVAGLLTILETGLGHLYSGNPGRGLILFCIDQLLFLLFIASFLIVKPNALHMIIGLSAILIFAVYCIVDAVLAAKRNGENYQPAKHNRWFVYVGFVLVAWLLVHAGTALVVNPYLVQAYSMPTSSMEPTLLVGDCILVNKRIYREGEPQRGDIIVFRSPLDRNVPYVKRLIGMPGDKVEIIGRTVYINGKASSETYAQYVDPGNIDGHFGPYQIPTDQYFVLGDNRNNCQDSRFWGCVPRKNLLGKPLVIYWSFETGRNEYLQTSISARLSQYADVLFHFFTKTRWARTFRIIE